MISCEYFGASHAPVIGFRLSGFPAGRRIDKAQLKDLLAQRAPGSHLGDTARREPDSFRLVSGVVEDGEAWVSDGATIVGELDNVDVRAEDYEHNIPRPGHADYPYWVKTGRIPHGGGASSGRMTAAMVLAGGICLQELARREIVITAEVEKTGDVAAAIANGDSVGGIVVGRIVGLPAGLGAPLLSGFDRALAAAMFICPGVVGFEIGAGFAAANRRGSENNDEFVLVDDAVRTSTNRHGGVLGGMTSGMPVEFRVAFKPTPSISLPQMSVDLARGEIVELRIRGRHDVAFVLRTPPVVRALAAIEALKIVLANETVIERVEVAQLALPSNAIKVIDSHVAELYPELAKGAVCVTALERLKTMTTLAELYHQFAQRRLSRLGVVYAIGGGVTLDMVGFAAATWMRGVDWIAVPTTLLAMVDAGLGGKTAVDLPEGKNLVGAFHLPRQILVDIKFLSTLSPSQLREGRAEMIKHALIAGNRSLAVSDALPTFAQVLAAAAVKQELVSADPYERLGLRIKLNCGHTVAHALEQKFEYQHLTHGEAVAIGCVEEARLAERLGLAAPGWGDEVAAIFREAALPVTLPDGLSFEELHSAMELDKKNAPGHLVFALPCGWGEVRRVEL